MHMTRLAYLTNSRLPTEKAHGYQICKMCEAFARHGIQVFLMHPQRPQRERALQAQSVFDYYGIRPIFDVRTLPSAGVRWRWLPRPVAETGFFLHALWWSRSAAQEAARHMADVYYTRDTEAAYWFTRSGLPTVYEAHEAPRRGQRWLLKRMARRPSLQHVVVLTSFLKARLIQLGFPDQKILILPDGVDVSLFDQLPGREACRRRLGLPVDRSIIGYIGRFRAQAREKGLPELVQAMARWPSSNGKEPLLLCVGGPMDAVPAYLALARRAGVQAHWLKFVDRVPNRDVPYWIRACDVVTIPWPWTEFSAHFTSPLKLFEYMASGVPIVASDLPSLREILRHGENAWLVEPGNPAALTSGLLSVLNDAQVSGTLSAQAAHEATRYTWLDRAGAILQALSS